MRQAKRRKLEAKGWRVGTAKEFLPLSDQESQFVELKLKLAESLRERRRQRHLAQTDVAKLLNSSQSRVAKMEAGDTSVSIDLMVRSLFALGASNPELARIIAETHSAPAANGGKAPSDLAKNHDRYLYDKGR